MYLAFVFHKVLERSEVSVGRHGHTPLQGYQVNVWFPVKVYNMTLDGWLAGHIYVCMRVEKRIIFKCEKH